MDFVKVVKEVVPDWLKGYVDMYGASPSSVYAMSFIPFGETIALVGGKKQNVSAVLRIYVDMRDKYTHYQLTNDKYSPSVIVHIDNIIEDKNRVKRAATKIIELDLLLKGGGDG